MPPLRTPQARSWCAQYARSVDLSGTDMRLNVHELTEEQVMNQGVHPRASPPVVPDLEAKLAVDAVVTLSAQAVVFTRHGLQAIAVHDADVSALILDESQTVECERRFSD